MLVGGAAPPGHRSNKWRTSSILQRSSDGLHDPTASSWSEPTDTEYMPHPTAGCQPAARRSWLCVVCRSCHPTMTRPPMSPPTPNSDLSQADDADPSYIPCGQPPSVLHLSTADIHMASLHLVQAGGRTAGAGCQDVRQTTTLHARARPKCL